MKKFAFAALALAALPMPALAQEVFGVFDNLGQCNSAWNAMVNATRQEKRSNFEGPGQKNAWQFDGLHCTKAYGLWLLVRY